MTQKTHTLDYNRLYRLVLDFDKDTNQLTIRVDDKSEPWPRLKQALLSQINIEGIPANTIRRYKDRIVFPKLEREFTLRLGLEPIGTYAIEVDGELSRTMKRLLTVSEVRELGTFYRAMLYPQQRKGLTAEENTALLKKAKTANFTDFHTHSSGQISPEGLIEVAKQHDAYYPLEWLKEAGLETSYVRYPKEMRKEVPRVNFPPRERPGVKLSEMVEAVPIRALREDELAVLKKRMAMPTDRQSTFSELENDAYYYRYPFAKNPQLIKDSLKQVAREYARQGIKYGVVTYVGLDKPNDLRIMHEAMDEIANDPVTKDVKLRFLVGIPRTFSIPKFEEALEKAKILMDSPYILGTDIIGYEMNKTKKFYQVLDRFYEWSNEHKPGSFHRIHAGENSKNKHNVKDALELAISHPKLHFLVGHGVFGLDEAAITLAKQLCADPENPRLTIEPNPSSVLALNNIDRMDQIPFRSMAENDIPFVVSSDSSGIYNTTALQLGLEAMYAGLDSKGFDKLIGHQTHLMNKQLAYSQQLADAIPDWNAKLPEKRKTAQANFIKGLVERIEKLPVTIEVPPKRLSDKEIRANLKKAQVQLIEPDSNVPELDSRKMIGIWGASGESWAQMTPHEQRESAIGIDMLIHALDPSKAYITEGRKKLHGISDVLDASTGDANHTNAILEKKPFYRKSLLAEANFEDPEAYAHLTHVERIPGRLLDLATAVVDHTFKHQGILIVVGGAAFSRDIILKADQRGVLDNHPSNHKMMMLLQCASGASADKAKMLSPAYRVPDGVSLVKKMHKHYPALFAADFDITKINELYEQSAQRVQEYNMNPADTVVGERELDTPHKQPKKNVRS